jgi:hypothetical protein
MPSFRLASVLLCLAAAPFSGLHAATPPGSDPVRENLTEYCVDCHNRQLRTGGLAFDASIEAGDLSNPSAHADVWEKVVKKLRSGTMPPPDAPRPSAAIYNETASWLETQLDQAAARAPYAGREGLHRLNRSEYANAIRDLLALDIDAEALLPPDDSAFGFDNVSEALGVSPSLQERYLKAALKIAALAVGDPNQPPGSQTWRIRQDLSQDQHIPGLALGTVGGTLAQYNFPVTGQYTLQAKLYRTNLNIVRGLQTTHQVEFSIDGKRVHLAAIGGPEDLASLIAKPTDTGDAVDARLQVRVPVTAGPHTVSVAFLRNDQFAEPARLQAFERSSVDNFDWAGHPHLQVLTVTGPFDPSRTPADTPSRRRIFICSPKAASEEAACARRIVAAILPRAYREPPSPVDIDRVLSFYEEGRKDGGFDAGIEAALERILASPKFIYRSSVPPAGTASGAIYRISGYELASRLSFFLWSSSPDDRLLLLAGQGKLKDPAILDAEVLRMLADPRAEALVKNFAGQWLQLRNLRNFQPNTDIFPDFDDNLRQGFRQETELLFQSVLNERRSVLDLLTADYTFVNERLAEHYGIPNVTGTRFRRVPVTNDARRGLLGQGSILALTSHAERTSPVVRGKWVLENLLGLEVPPPPANVPPLKEHQAGDKPHTMREQMAEHRANPVCAACHKTLDPIGFSLENFNAVGAWRDNEAGQPVDASGELADGTKVNGAVELRKALLGRPELFVGTVTQKLMIYALGRGLDPRDMPQIRSIVRASARNNYRLTDLILGVIHSTEFQRNTCL